MTSLLLSRSCDDIRDQLPRVDESVVLCPMSRRQNFLYSDYLAKRFSVIFQSCRATVVFSVPLIAVLIIFVNAHGLVIVTR